MDENKNEFVRETIKDKPINKKRLYMKLGFTALSALIFAVIFCAFTAIFLPPFLKMRGVTTKSEQVKSTQDIDTQTQATETTTTEISTEQMPVMTPSLTLDSYQDLLKQLHNIGNAARDSIVTITSTSSKVDWFNDSYEKEGDGCGAIVADDSQSYYILTEQSVVHGASAVSVTFEDATTCNADVIAVDERIGIAILSVKKSDMQKTTLGRVKMIKIANSNTMNTGTIVLALGRPLASSHSVLSGTITATDLEASFIDYNFRMFNTDMISNANASAFLINTQGELVAFAMQSLQSKNNSIQAISIQDLNPVINKLINARSIVHLGLSVTTVTNRISRDYGLPSGIYIKSVENDSLGATAGLQVGDVIDEVNGKKVTSVEQYDNVLFGLQTGQTVKVVVSRKGANGFSKFDYTITIGEK